MIELAGNVYRRDEDGAWGLVVDDEGSIDWEASPTLSAALDKIERLEAIVSRLPQDASGRHVIAHEDELYHPKHPGGVGFYDGEQAAFYCGANDYDYYPLKDCWPTKEQAEKARDSHAT